MFDPNLPQLTPTYPNLPQAGTEIDAVQMRSQLNSLKALIDAVPGITSVVIDGVNTLPPGDAATVSASVSGTVLHLSFGIPSGLDGPQGPPFAAVIVDAVNTLPPGSMATVSATFDGVNVHLTFGIPAGQQGPQGDQGIQGNQGGDGAQGMQGPPGEVTLAQLTAAIGGTSNISNSVTTLDTAFADPDDEIIRAKINELVLALRR